jgi:hypothetical protein
MTQVARIQQYARFVTRNGAVIQDAETYLRSLAEAQLRQAAGRRGSDAWRELQSVQLAAGALSEVGAIDTATADEIAVDLEVAFAARGRIRNDSFERLISPQWRRYQVKPAPAGPFRTVSVETQVVTDIDGEPATITPFALVAAPDRTVLTVEVNRITTHNRVGWAMTSPGWYDVLSQVIITDSNGGKRGGKFWGGGSHDHAGGRVELNSPLPAGLEGLTWVELDFGAGAEPLRVDLSRAPVQPMVATRERHEATPAERYIDAATEELLITLVRNRKIGTSLAANTELDRVIEAFTATGVIEPGSLALSRLATVARRFKLRLPDELAGLADTELPEEWLSAIAAMPPNGRGEDSWDSRRFRQQLSGALPAAIVFPELGGARWTVAGMRRAGNWLRMNVLGWGVPVGARHLMHYGLDTLPEPFTWWARDDTGQWYFTSVDNGGLGEDGAEFDLELTPELSLDATSLDLILSGLSGRLTATIPLDGWPS